MACKWLAQVTGNTLGTPRRSIKRYTMHPKRSLLLTNCYTKEISNFKALIFFELPNEKTERYSLSARSSTLSRQNSADSIRSQNISWLISSIKASTFTAIPYPFSRTIKKRCELCKFGLRNASQCLAHGELQCVCDWGYLTFFDWREICCRGAEYRGNCVHIHQKKGKENYK